MALTFLHLKCNNHMFDLRLKIKGSKRFNKQQNIKCFEQQEQVELLFKSIHLSSIYLFLTASFDCLSPHDLQLTVVSEGLQTQQIPTWAHTSEMKG